MFIENRSPKHIVDYQSFNLITIVFEYQVQIVVGWYGVNGEQILFNGIPNIIKNTDTVFSCISALSYVIVFIEWPRVVAFGVVTKTYLTKAILSRLYEI